MQRYRRDAARTAASAAPRSAFPRLCAQPPPFRQIPVVCGVDLLRSDRGPLVMEVNSSPGIGGIEAATGKDVANLIIEFIEREARPKRTRTRGTG